MAIVWQERDYIKVGRHKLFYEVTGKGEPVLLLHGSFNDSRIWDSQVKALVAAGYKVVTCDLRGSGKSDKPTDSFENTSDLKLLINVLGLERISIVGSSSGSAIAIDFTLLYPERVRSIILAVPVVNGLFPPLSMLWRTLRNYNNINTKGAERAVEIFIEDPYWSFFFPAPENEEARKKVLDLVRSSGNFCSWNPNLSVPLKPYAKKRLDEIKAPVLIVPAGNDHPFYLKTAELLRKNISHSRTIMMEGCGHSPFVEKPDVFNRMMLDFL
ncbi:MAG: alpha/beta hydrolase [Gorillibacterium sp.]|nr:alpha/beta hydrolase [Gorillibacterium sp.]